MMPQITDYTGMIKKTTWQKHTQTGVDLDELESRAGMIFVEALGSFDPTKKTKFGTYFYMLLNQQLISYERGWNKEYYPQTNTDTVERYSNGIGDPAKLIEFWDTLNHLGEDAKAVINLVISAPEEIVDDAMGRPKLMAGNIHRKLEKLGWSGSRVWNTFTEIRQILAR